MTGFAGVFVVICHQTNETPIFLFMKHWDVNERKWDIFALEENLNLATLLTRLFLPNGNTQAANVFIIFICLFYVICEFMLEESLNCMQMKVLFTFPIPVA